MTEVLTNGPSLFCHQHTPCLHHTRNYTWIFAVHTHTHTHTHTHRSAQLVCGRDRFQANLWKGGGCDQTDFENGQCVLFVVSSGHEVMSRVGRDHIHIYTLYMNVYLVISLPITLYIYSVISLPMKLCIRIQAR